MLSIGRCLGISQLPSVGHQPLGEQEMVRGEALVRRRRDEPLVEVHQLVQVRRAAPPVADDEHRRLLDLASASICRPYRSRWTAPITELNGVIRPIRNAIGQRIG